MTMTNKVKRQVYLLVYDIYTTGDDYVLKFNTLEEARTYRDVINKKPNEYGKVHIEVQTIEREVID